MVITILLRYDKGHSWLLILPKNQVAGDTQKIEKKCSKKCPISAYFMENLNHIFNH